MYILRRYSTHVGGGHFLNLCRKLVGRVETEDESVEDGVFGALDFFVREGLFGQVVDLFIHRLDRFDRALALGADEELQNAGMPEVGADAASDFVGETALGAEIVEQARGHSSAKRFIEHGDGVVVGIVARGAQRDHADAALVYIVFGNEVIAGLGWVVLNVIFRQVGTFGPSLESRAQLGFHRRGIEVSTDAKNYVVGMYIGAMPVDQILARDCGHGCVLRFTGVGIIGAIRQLGGFARHDLSYLIVAPRDAVLGLLLCQVKLLGAEFGVLQEVGEDFEDIVEIAFQATQSYGG